jgi:hypothetical protein
VRYATAEHFMMAGKARLFGDAEAERLVLASDDPARAKAAGRAVRGFDEEGWAAYRFGLVVAANDAKFGQHPALDGFLLGTGRTRPRRGQPVRHRLGYRARRGPPGGAAALRVAWAEPARLRADGGPEQAPSEAFQHPE